MLTRILFFLGLILNASIAQEGASQRLALLEKGINIPHWYWLRQPDVRIPNHIVDEDINALKKLGFGHVRIPFEMADLDKPEITEHLKKDINRFVKYGMGVVVSAFGERYNKDLISEEGALQWLQKLCTLLIGTNPEFVFVQIANEPFPKNPKEWTKFQNVLLKGARQVLPHHTLITSTPLKFDSGEGDFNMFTAFANMKPSDDPNVVYAFHFYDPYFFTHQGANWDVNTMHIKGLVYPTHKENITEVASKLPENTLPWVRKELHKIWDNKALAESLKPILAWRETHKRPVMITEFGILKDHANNDSRARWLADVASLFKTHQIPWSFWHFDGGFGLFTPKDGFLEVDQEAAKALGLNYS